MKMFHLLGLKEKETNQVRKNCVDIQHEGINKFARRSILPKLHKQKQGIYKVNFSDSIVKK